MLSRISTLILGLLLPVAGLAQPSGVCVNAWVPGGEYAVFVVPDGSGAPLTEARLADGTVVDGTIGITVFDIFGDPVVGLPAADLLLVPEGGPWAACSEHGGVTGFPADGPTNALGQTHFSLPLRGGGWTEGMLTLYFQGEPAYDCEIIEPSLVRFPHRFNSADIDGDLDVDLSDATLFAQNFFGGYHFRGDFVRDGVINLADLSLMAAAIGRGVRVVFD